MSGSLFVAATPADGEAVEAAIPTASLAAEEIVKITAVQQPTRL
jgi:hypothetical protein